ncbi:hypothetical protein GHK92_17520 [Nocardioides sp. dk4132]|uniref:hypothetical protein n=1 Tax=unclassified Nocardioides TaxID=2615069 RepID=UPI0012953659|nr:MULTISPECIES: hypothetical protein [unclassified Nocardioides]MQW77674.1 hypothetical protein [Nocardioides sp. dk4132]
MAHERDRWSIGRHLDPWFDARFESTWSRRLAKVVAVVVVVGLGSYLLGVGLGRAAS